MESCPMTFLDGGFGTMIQAAGLPAGKDPADWNVENPSAVASVHRAYVEAGADVVLTNTFGANRLKYRGPHDLGEVIRAALANARASGAKKVALDIGPTGRLLAPAGDLSFEAAYSAFAEQICLATTSLRPSTSGLQPDLIFIETIGDVRELKAAVLAAKESCSLPVYASVALGEEGNLLTGGSVECVAALLESLGVDAYGFNCGLGPDRMLPFVERLARVSTKPILVKPNAGMPTLVDGKTVFKVGPDDFAGHVRRLVAAGASIVGGCCGTTPEHIRAVASHVSRLTSSPSASHVSCLTSSDGSTTRDARPGTRISSGTVAVALRSHEGLVIGERINPTGKKLLKEAFAKGDTAYVLREAVKQVEAGARILDVNCGVPGLDEAALLAATVEAVQGVVTCPVQIDTADPKALEGALRRVNGKPLVNSVNGKRESMDAVFPLVKRYGGLVVGLCLDETGIPPTAEGRLAIARKILAEGAKYGFTKDDFVFDALTLAVSAEPTAARVTLETVRRLTDELGVNTVLGVSNVSFGLPNRPAINNTMYALAKKAGLSAAIANPLVLKDEIDPDAEAVLMGTDPNCERWIAKAGREISAAKTAGREGAPRTVGDGDFVRAAPSRPDIAQQDANGKDSFALVAAIRSGLKDDAGAAARAMLASGRAPLDVIGEGIVPALETVGRKFETGEVFLPQLLRAADAAGEAFAVVRAQLKHQAPGTKHQAPGTSPRPIVLATVKGDVHDIGKNIVRALLENYGFEVIDLGRDVAPETVVETARRTNAWLIGLSALMTTTVGAMEETIRQAKAAGLSAKIVVGGAVVTQEFADSIGADFYAKDAMRTVRIAESLSGKI